MKLKAKKKKDPAKKIVAVYFACGVIFYGISIYLFVTDNFRTAFWLFITDLMLSALGLFLKPQLDIYYLIKRGETFKGELCAYKRAFPDNDKFLFKCRAEVRITLDGEEKLLITEETYYKDSSKEIEKKEVNVIYDRESGKCTLFTKGGIIRRIILQRLAAFILCTLYALYRTRSIA